jgi:deazaflavin-dependent oxidoreductase (nitroreductase family)
VKLYPGVVRRLGRHRAVARALSLVLPPIDGLFVRRRRSLTSLGTGFPLCYLTTTGRRTGELHTVPLLHVADGDRVVLVASNWGRRRHPAWALNLDSHRQASITVDGVERACTARRATHDEYTRYWAAAARIWPGYDDYRARAGREIRMFVLEPVSGRPGVSKAER